MKTLIASLLMLLAIAPATVVFAAADDYFSSVSTVGPDCYADGLTRVKPGECYALVCTKPGETFAGFLMDGSLVNPAASDVVMFIPTKAEGRLNVQLAEVSKAYYTEHRADVWELYLLDTRGADGLPRGLGPNGRPVRINGWGRTTAEVQLSTSSFVRQGGRQTETGVDFSTTAAEEASVPADAPSPRIVSITPASGKTAIGFTKTVEWMTYDIVAADSLDELKTASVVVGKPAVDGNADPQKVVSIETAGTDGRKQRFMKIVGVNPIRQLSKGVVK